MGALPVHQTCETAGDFPSGCIDSEGGCDVSADAGVAISRRNPATCAFGLVDIRVHELAVQSFSLQEARRVEGPAFNPQIFIHVIYNDVPLLKVLKL